MQNEEIDIVEEADKPYNIRHRCFHFSKELILFIQETKYERIYNKANELIVEANELSKIIASIIINAKNNILNFTFFHF